MPFNQRSESASNLAAARAGRCIALLAIANAIVTRNSVIDGPIASYSAPSTGSIHSPLLGNWRWTVDSANADVRNFRMQSRMKIAIADTGLSGHWIASANAGELPGSGGAYLLAFRLREPVRLDIPRLAASQAVPGWYVYAGSARGSGGIRARVARHFRTRKTIHWHIDRLTAKADGMSALAVPAGQECELVDALLRSRLFTAAIAGFGSTDCRRCRSHLLAATPC